MDCDVTRVKNQEQLKRIDVLSWLRQDKAAEVDLTSDQKVAGSSPAGCTTHQFK